MTITNHRMQALPFTDATECEMAAARTQAPGPMVAIELPPDE